LPWLKGGGARGDPVSPPPLVAPLSIYLSIYLYLSPNLSISERKFAYLSIYLSIYLALPWKVESRKQIVLVLTFCGRELMK